MVMIMMMNMIIIMIIIIVITVIIVIMNMAFIGFQRVLKGLRRELIKRKIVRMQSGLQGCLCRTC